MAYDINIIFPDVLKIGLNEADFKDFNNLSLSLTSDVVASMSQDISTIPVSKRYQYFNGITKGMKQFSISGIVTDDNVYGQMVQTFGVYASYRAYIATKLEYFYDNETLLTFWDTQIGFRNNLIITGLEQRPSSDYVNASEWSITFTQVKFIKYIVNNNTYEKTKTIDPYRYFLFN